MPTRSSFQSSFSCSNFCCTDFPCSFSRANMCCQFSFRPCVRWLCRSFSVLTREQGCRSDLFLARCISHLVPDPSVRFSFPRRSSHLGADSGAVCSFYHCHKFPARAFVFSASESSQGRAPVCSEQDWIFHLDSCPICFACRWFSHSPPPVCILVLQAHQSQAHFPFCAGSCAET
jgi:hypothetical protein